MIKRFYILLLAIVASVGMSWAAENSITINGTPQVGDNSISLTYYFDPGNVPGITGYAPTLKVKCVTDNIWDEVWLSLSEISSGTTTITLDNLGSFQEGKSYDVCFAYYNGSWVDDVFQSFTPAAPAPAVIDLATITSDYVIPDGATLTGTLGTNVKITIAAGATVTLNGVDINGSGTWTGGDYAGITCPGNATIILADGTVNRIKGFLNGNSAIHIKPNYTLTIEGDGTLYASTQGGAAAIGCGYSDSGGSRNGGNIVINGGTIYANGGSLAAGIGGGGRATIGNITINGGIIYAVGGGTGAGIGGGQSKSNSWKSICGNITISSNVKYLKATKGSGAAHSIGKGSSSYSVCGTVTIPGGATGYVSTSPYVYCNPDYVIELINAIPQPVVYTDECKAAIDEARAMYTDLTDDQKTSVTNYSTLTDAEEAYADLLAQKVAPVIAAINAVPATPLTDATKKLSEYNKVKAAREAYDALSDEEKVAVTNYDKLEAAEAAFAAISGGAPAGALSGKFTINEGGDQIAFAKGNLQATTEDLGETWTWGFAANQWDFVGDAAANNAINGDKSVSANGSVDIFGWSTEATYYGIHNSEDNATYSGDFKDWGSNIGEGWRTLTQDEWIYLLKTRTDASSKFGMATVADVHGMIVLPDDYAGAAINSARDAWDNNIISASDWAAYEAAGVVFLPAGGNREGKYVYLVGSNGHYWSSTNYGEEEANSIYFGSDFYKANGIFSRKYSHSVRLVTSNEGISPIAAAQAAVALINAIPQPVVYTPECKEAIKAAREAVDALGANASLLDDADLQKLTDAEAAYAQLLAQAVKAVKDQIDALPATPLTDATKKLSEYNKVKAAREAYDALSDEEKAAVDNYDKLTAAEAAFAAIPSVGSETVITWDKNTGIEKISGTTTSPAYEGITISIKGGGFGPQDDMLRFNIAGLGLSFEFANTLGGNFQKIVISSTNAMPSTPLAGMGEGWAASSGNKIATWTGDAATVKIWDGLTATSYWDVNTIQFTLGATVSAIEAAQAALDKINAIPSPVVLSDECNAAIKAAREAVTALGENASLIDDADLQKLTDAEAALTALNQAVADEVIAKINNIPTPVELKLATRDSINNARAAYDALTADQQALVTNYQTLLDAEAALAALNPGVPPATPLDSAQAVKDLIDAIPTPVEYPTSGPAIAAALVAYNQLSGAAKGALDDADVQKMTDAAAQYAALDAIAAIEAIPAEIVYDPAVKAAIETAREKYDALIDASKALVPEDKVHKLTNAEQAWAILVAKIEHNVSYIGKDGELKNEKVALLHIPDPAPDFNGYEFVRWDVKAGDFLEEGLRIKAIYTPIITTDPQGFDTLAYNGLAQELVKAGVAKEGHIEYSLYPEEPESWSAELPKATFAGVYAIYYKLVREGHADYIAPEPTMATIAKVPVTYVAPTAVESLVYTASNQTLIAAGQTQDGTFEYSLDPTLLDSWKTELPQAKDAGTYSVYYRVQGDLNHLDSVAATPVAVTIAKEELTATADDKNVIYGDAVPAYTVTYSGWQGDDDATVLTGELAFACTYAPTSNVDEYTITPSGVSAANYTITFVDGKVTVAKAALMITAEDKNVIYGDAVPEYTATYSGWKNTDGASVVSGLIYTCEYAPTSNVGEYTIVPSGATATNYNISYTNGKVTVAKAALMITADDKNVIYGDAVPEYTATYSGWKNTDGASVVSGLIYTCEYAPTSNVGEYTIVPSGAAATNYAISYTNGKVTVAKAALMITAENKNVIYGDAVPEYTATYSGWKNSDDASVVSNLAYTCEYAPTSNVGEYTITPNSADAQNYAISYTNGKVTVAQATLTVTAENKTVTYGDAAPEFTVTYEGWKNSDDASVVSNLAYTCDYLVTSNVGNYTITPHSATALNYAFVYVNGTLTVNQAALMITAEDKDVIYGDAVPTYTVTYSGWKNSDDESVVSGLVYTCEYAPTSNVGEYAIIPHSATATNYAINYTEGVVTVAKADLMITAENKNVIYGDAVPEYTATYSGWKNSDDASVVSGLAYTCEYAPTSNVGEYTITPNSATAQNYAISYTNGKITVAQAALTITAENKEMIYGDEHPEFTVTYSGWKNSDDESVVSGLAYTTPYAPGSPIGTYAINPNSATALNYAITFVNGTLTVNKAHVYVSGAEVHTAKFADGHANAEVTKQGTLNGIKLNDPIAHVTTAAFSSADVAEHLTITLFYELTGDDALLKNYNLDPTSEIFSTEGVIIEPFIPNNDHQPEEEEQVEVKEGIDVYAYGYCDGSGYSLKYHLNSGNPDQYKIDFADSRFTDVDWTNLVTTGKDGTIDIEIPVDLPTGDYTMTVYFRDSRFDWLESQQFNVTFHVNLPETFIRPLFDNVIALVDTCHCLTDIQWYWRANSSDPWEPIPGATGYYYHVDGKLTGEYFVKANMNGEPTYTCGQSDMETLYGETQKAQAPVVKAYPNPVVNTTTVAIENSLEWNHNLRIVNLMGVEVMNTTFEGNETSVEMSGYPQGNYMISVDGIVVKVMKQ